MDKDICHVCKKHRCHVICSDEVCHCHSGEEELKKEIDQLRRAFVSLVSCLHEQLNTEELSYLIKEA